MKICLAQLKAHAGDVSQNLTDHCAAIAQAVRHHAQLIVFPELSLTGYEPQLARQLASHSPERDFHALQALSDRHSLTICAGMPLKVEARIGIGMLIFQPHEALTIYTKQCLHEDEQPFFVPGTKQVSIACAGQQLAPAICYESRLPAHVAGAVALGATVYLCSVAKPADGVEKVYAYYPQVARRYTLPVVMANSVGPADNFTAVGQSGAWNASGLCIGQLDAKREGLLMVDLVEESCQRIAP